MKILLSTVVVICLISINCAEPTFKALAFYSNNVEPDHQKFARDALKFYKDVARKNNFSFESTTDWSKMNDQVLKNYKVILWLNNQSWDNKGRTAFQKYIESGGGWLGFHVAAYNDKYTKWPWFVQFLGGGVFYSNNWPPMPAQLIVDNNTHPVTKRLPKHYLSPANEFYNWVPSPRKNPNVTVLATLDPKNYPLGKKDILTSGDIPVVWTNNKYNILYINMGHGDKIFTSQDQNHLIEDALLWLGNKKSFY